MKHKVFDFLDYRIYLKNLLRSMPSQGHGQLAKMAQALNINPSIVTLVLKGSKNFSLEQAIDLAEYLGFSELETDYLLASVNHARAGKPNLQKKYLKQIEKLKTKANKFSARVSTHTVIQGEANSIFYSQWYYSAIRMLSSLEEYGTIEALSNRLSLPRNKVKAAIDFLVEHQLCKEVNNQIRLGPQRTHLDADSLLVTRHHSNWRLKSMQSMEQNRPDEFFFSSPVSLAKSDIPKIRALLSNVAEDFLNLVGASPSEEVACLNIDWFRI